MYFEDYVHALAKYVRATILSSATRFLHFSAVSTKSININLVLLSIAECPLAPVRRAVYGLFFCIVLQTCLSENHLAHLA